MPVGFKVAKIQRLVSLKQQSRSARKVRFRPNRSLLALAPGEQFWPIALKK